MEPAINGDRIRELRISKSLSQDQLAEACGLHPRTVQRIEKDNRASLQSRSALARALKVDPFELDLPPGLSDTNTNKTLNLIVSLFGLINVMTLAVYCIFSLIWLTLYKDSEFAQQLWISMLPLLIAPLICLPPIIVWRRKHNFR